MIENFLIYQIFFILRMLSMVTSEENVIDYKESTEKIPILPYLQENSDESIWCDNWDSFPNGRSHADVESFNENRRKIKNQDEEPLRNNDLGKISGKEYFVEFHSDDAEPRVEKRFAIFKSKYPLSGYLKRKPGFNSWGGKRSSSQVNDYLENKSKEENSYDKMVLSKSPNSLLDAEKRTRFFSWGGKRDDVTNYENPSDEMSKRSWSDPIFYNTMKNQIQLLKSRALYNQDLFKKFVPKRPKFQSWGGKRSSPTVENVPGIFYFRYFPARIPFDKAHNADDKRKYLGWDDARQNEIYDDVPKRASHSFNSWGGKRSDEYVDTDKRSPRHSFNSWGGKRDVVKSNVLLMQSKPKQTSNSSEDTELQRKKRDQLHSSPSKKED